MDILLVGYGSIGARHGAILDELGCRVTVASNNEDCPHPRFSSLEKALAAKHYQGAIVATPTGRHLESLRTLTAALPDRILVEKPLFDHAPGDVPAALPERVHTAYNMRCHPMLRRVKEVLAERPLYSITAYVGQYLPQWRPSRDYRQSYSARKEEGGGALRDLSHELDYLQWLSGSWQAVAAWGGRVGPLEINSDDVYGLMLRTDRCPLVMVQLNYLDMAPGGRRELLVNAEGLTLHANLNAGLLSVNGNEPEFIKPERNHTYREQIKSWLADPQAAELCDYYGGMEVVRLIDAAETSALKRCWVER